MLDTYFGGHFKDANVLVTGHTGFKGSWLCCWLHVLGARVAGVSKDVPTVPSHFEAIGLDEMLDDQRLDIRDAAALESLVKKVRPRFLFHLAAQPIVQLSYEDPTYTIETNVMGTVNVLSALRKADIDCTAVLITSDKCYENNEWIWGYRENDRLGGKDIYSASKAAAETLIRAYVGSFLSDSRCSVRVGIGRAGNVVGGGDWAPYRLVPDCVRAWSATEDVIIRNPASTRPWQHVLEPLSGYLSLAQHLTEKDDLHGEAFNFGPSNDSNHMVSDLIAEISKSWDKAQWRNAGTGKDQLYEAGLLKLNCDKAANLLRWGPVLTFSETVEMTANWYKAFYQTSGANMLAHSLEQIRAYCELATQRQAPWSLPQGTR